MLLDAGAHVNLVPGGFSALYKATQGGHDRTAALLLRWGDDTFSTTIQDPYRLLKMPSHLSRGADANTAAPDGSTPLLTAAYIGNVRALPRRSSARRGFHSESSCHGAFAWARRALSSPFEIAFGDRVWRS